MTSSRLVRGTIKTRTIAVGCLILLLLAVVYIFHGTQSRLADVQRVANTCTQQAESLSAQFQVLFEYKLRLEKSLQAEKRDHKMAVEDAEKKMKEEKDARQKEREESASQLRTKSDEYDVLKKKFDDMEVLYKRQITEISSQKSLMQKAHDTVTSEIEEYKKAKIEDKAKIAFLEDEVSRLKDTVTDLKARNLPQGEADKLREELRKELDQAKKEAAECKAAAAAAKAVTSGGGGAADLLSPKDTDLLQPGGALEPPGDNGSEAKGSSTTTPGINPQALYTADSSSPKPSTKEALRNDDSAFLTFKKSTPESRGQAAPLAVPGAQEQQNHPDGVGQIPIPHAGFAKPMAQDEALADHDNQWASDDKKDVNNAAVEEMNDFPPQNENRRNNRVGGANYADRDYKEDPGDEDDDDGERDYGVNQGQRHDHIQPFNNMDSPNEGIHIIPK